MIKTITRLVLVFVLAFIALFIATVAIDPDFSTMSRDGGAFAYCGWRITQGALLYRDCWDNKPPAVYYLNAAVIAVGGSSQWNIWLFQALWLSLTSLAFFIVIKKIWSPLTASLCTALLLLTLLYPLYFSNGNLTETYALLPITLILGSFWGYLSTRQRVYLLGIGFFTALAFLFKPTYISMGAAAFLVLIISAIRSHHYRLIPREIAFTGLGFIVPLLLTAAYWAAQHDLRDLLYAVFIHNQLYVEQGFTWKAMLATIRIFIIEEPLAALFACALISVIIFAIERWKLIWQANPGTASPYDKSILQVWVMLSLIITFLLDAVFTALPGTNFRHYYLVPILSLAALSAYLIDYFFHHILGKIQTSTSAALGFSALLLIMLPWFIEVIGKELPSQSNVRELITNPHIRHYQPNPVEKFILENTSPEQSILIWDYDPSIYFHVDRRSPTRFIFLRHLYTPIPGAPTGFSEFMQELQNDPPELIITQKTSQQGLPYLGLDENSICSDCPADIRAGVLAFKQYVSQYYQAYTDVETWAVYRRLK